MKWQDDSEIVAGLVLTNRLSSTAVRPEIFFGDYEKLIRLIKEGVTEPEELMSKVGLNPFQTAIDASKTINGLSTMDWPRILETSYANYSAGTQFERLGKKLQKGDDIDWSVVNKISSKAQEGLGGDFTRLSDITPGKVPFIKSGWELFDEHLAGYPEVGVIVVGGDPGSGKTWFMTNAVSRFASYHKDKNVGVFTIEMMQRELALRFVGEKLPESVTNRILINDVPVSPDEVISKSATIENLGLVVIDFADLMITGETSESTMANIYRTLMIGSKNLGCPIMLLSQLNRAKTGIPKPSNLRWTGLAEALAWMVLMIYNPSSNWQDKEDDIDSDRYLPPMDLGKKGTIGYIIAWKIRGGFINHPNDFPGAIAIPFKGNLGWHPTKGHGSNPWRSLKRL